MNPLVTFVVAMDQDGVIGADGKLPWRLPADLKRFKTITWSKPILMGRLTHESIGRTLPGRVNVVLSRDPAYRAEGCVVVPTLERAIHAVRAGEVMVIGGSVVFREAMPLCDRIHLTRVEARFPSPNAVVFPDDFAKDGRWMVTREEHHPADATNPHPHAYFLLDRPERAGPNARPLTDDESRRGFRVC